MGENEKCVFYVMEKKNHMDFLASPVRRYTSPKFGLHSFHPPVSENSVINSSLLWSILFLYWLIERHYPVCGWLVKSLQGTCVQCIPGKDTLSL